MLHGYSESRNLEFPNHTEPEHLVVLPEQDQSPQSVHLLHMPDSTKRYQTNQYILFGGLGTIYPTMRSPQAKEGKHGDYTFDVIHPNNIDIDHTATSEDDLNWICHSYEMTVKEILMKWPNKKEALFNELKWDSEVTTNEKRLASKLKINEIWFTWYKKENEKWVRLEGVAWKYGKCVFDKIKHPYWDWEGETNYFTYDVETKGKKPVSEDEIRNSMIFGEPMNVSAERVYHNHFDKPRKPFKFMTHEGLKTMVYDETSRIEQSLWLQDNVNVRGRQITELANTAKGKNVFSTESGLTAEDVAQIDMADPNSDILIDGNLGQVHTYIPI